MGKAQPEDEELMNLGDEGGKCWWIIKVTTPWRCLETGVPTHSRRNRQDDPENARGIPGRTGIGGNAHMF